MLALEDAPHKIIGGVDKIVEIDESKFGKRQVARGSFIKVDM